ncbi:MAG: FtsX-like permease family protein [Clostridium sp.]
MKKYSELVNKQFKVNKIRNIYTVIGIVLGIVLFTTVGNLNHFINNKNIEEAKYYRGNYEVIFRLITEDQLNLIKGNVKVLTSEEVFDENTQLRKNNESSLNEEYSKMDVGVKLKGNSNKRKSIKEISEIIGVENTDSTVIVELNEMLIDAYENSVIGEFTNLNEEKIGIMFINIAILLLTSILTYGSINVSMKERIQYFSTLRCIGATGDKIKYLLIKESFMLGALSIIPGLIIGNILSFTIVNVVFREIMKIELYGAIYEFNFGVTISTILMTIFTIIMSAIIPVMRSGKISPIQGVKIGGVNKKVIKKRKNRLIRKIFGYKGELAYKNIRGNNKNFIIATITLSLLLIIFVSFTGYCMGALQGFNEEDIKEKDAVISFDNWYAENSEGLIDSIFEKQKDIIRYLDGKVHKEDLETQIEISIRPILKDLKSEKVISNETSFTHNEDEYAYIAHSKLIIYNEEAIKNILPYIEGGNVSIQDFENNGILFVNKNKESSLLKRKYKNISNLNKNDIFSLYLNEKRVSEESLEEEIKTLSEIKAKFIGNIDSRYIYNWRNNDSENGLITIVSEEFYKNNKDVIDKSIISSSSFLTDFDFMDNEKINENMMAVETYAKENRCYVIDNMTSFLELKRQVLGIATITYTILIISMAIGVINIINNKTINLSLRKKEFGTMLAIGLKKEDFRKIIMLEGIVQWFISSLIGGLISYTILRIIFIAYAYLGEIENNKSPNFIIVFGIVMLLIINLLASRLSLKRYKDLSTIELIREEE